MAGGLGTRLRTVVKEVPKCMAPVNGKPFLQYLLNYLKRFDVSRVILSVGYLREAAMSWIEANKGDYPFTFDFSIETEPLGTGGGIRLALSKAHTENVLVVNGDTFFNVDLDDLMGQHLEGNSPISIALKPMRDFDRYGNVILEKPSPIGGKVAEFKEKEPCVQGLVNGGIYAINKEKGFPEGLPGKFSFETGILKPFADEGKVRGLIHDDYFIDIGIPEDYGKAQKELPELERIMEIAEADYPGFDTLFLDRDGVINRLRPGDYVRKWEDFEAMPGIMEALSLLSGKFKHIILVTNQRGIGKGLMDESDLETIHKRMVEEIENHGGRLDKIYHCPALDESDLFRKPNTGMFSLACKDFPDISPERSIMIGDSESDMEFARNCGMKGIRL